jgi:hypothetical protein
MSELEIDDPFEDIHSGLARIVERSPISTALEFETKRTTPAKFLNVRFKKELTVFLHLSQTRIIKFAGLCLASADAILKNPARDWKFPQLFALCVY